MKEDICSVCGLPQEICVCGEVEKEESLVEIKVERRKYGKFWAVVSGIDQSQDDLKKILKFIKNKLACGGTIKGKTIEVLYGRNPRNNDLVSCLVELGFNKDSIHIS